MTAHAVFLVLSVASWISLAVWVVLLVGRGGFWRMNPRLPATDRDDAGRVWPAVAAVVPARDEAGILPATLPSVLAQDYPGAFSVVVVDDASTDGTGELAAELAVATPNAAPLRVVRGSGPPPGWAGKVAAMDRGVRAIGEVGVGVSVGGGGGGGGDGGGEGEGDCSSGSGSGSGSGRSIVGAEGGAAIGEVRGVMGNCDVGALSSAAGGDGGGGEGPEYLLFTDSDIAHPADSVRRLVQHAQDERLDLVSLMARLSTDSPAERMIVPAFVFSFFQLYPPAWVSRPGSRTAAAAGGCMLVRREALERVGGLAGIADARIDDVALGTLIKRGEGRTWLGVTTEVRSLRPYPRLADLWDMIARSAYTQLRYSPWLLVGTIIGLVLTYGVPPVLGLGGLATQWWGVAIPALAAWAVMSATYMPVLRLYGLPWWRAPLLPGVMAAYGAMTIDSARRHRQGRGGAWKGRVIASDG